jgi:N-acyl-D-amino-acid deacylase
VRETGTLTLPDAIRKMTSLPATKFGFMDRGVIREGSWADIVIFDYDTIRDTATWTDAMRYPEGIDAVIVNGVIVARNGKHTGATPGHVLRGPGYGR